MPGISIVKATVFTKIKGFCSQYKAVYDKLVELDDVPDTLIAKEQNKMVRQNVAYIGWADVFDIKYVLAQQYNNNGGALINWINPGTFDATAVSAPVFTSLEGFDFNGSNQHLDTNYDPGNDKINLALNSMAAGVYIRKNVFPENTYDFGVKDATNWIALGTSYASACRYYANTNVAQWDGVADSLGMHVINRVINTNEEIWKNKVRLENPAQASNGIPTGFNIYIGGLNSSGVHVYRSTKQISAFFVSKGVTQSNIEITTDAIEGLMDFSGKGVIV